jgi:putative Holliday junction resolvase
VRAFELRLQQLFPDKPVHRWDERYTSKMAGEAMRQGGANKKQRQDKHLINAVAAVIILQEYLVSP